MLALFTLQSPTLLNILAKSRQWRLEYMQAPTRLAEASQLRAPAWAGSYPDAVFVCTQEHLDIARNVFTRARHWWVAHNGRDIGPLDVPTLAFSETVAEMQRRAGVLDVRVVVPYYRALAIWKWEPGLAWSMLSRIEGRHPEYPAKMEQLRRYHDVTLFGEGQPAGFLDEDGKRKLWRSSSCYASPLPAFAGFGLAQHECFAAGVPVVGSRWGDLAREAPSAWSSLSDDADAQGDALVRLCGDRPYAERMSVHGLELIEKHRHFDRMEAGIAAIC